MESCNFAVRSTCTPRYFSTKQVTAVQTPTVRRRQPQSTSGNRAYFPVMDSVLVGMVLVYIDLEVAGKPFPLLIRSQPLPPSRATTHHHRQFQTHTPTSTTAMLYATLVNLFTLSLASAEVISLYSTTKYGVKAIVATRISFTTCTDSCAYKDGFTTSVTVAGGSSDPAGFTFKDPWMEGRQIVVAKDNNDGKFVARLDGQVVGNCTLGGDDHCYTYSTTCQSFDITKCGVTCESQEWGLCSIQV